jgi:uncharacterized membrane protein HdeD (DUF308 family)
VQSIKALPCATISARGFSQATSRKITSVSENKTLGASSPSGLDEISSSWGWFAARGSGLVLLGAICVIGAVTATSATVLALGWLLIAGAVLSLIQAFRAHKWNGLFLYLLSALLRGVTGYLLVRYPFTGEISLTLFLASFFIVGGTFRAVGAGTLKFPQWGWAAFSGIIAVALGILLLMRLPVSSLWFIGFAIGIEFIFDGTSCIALGAALRRVPGDRVFAKA